MTEENKTPANEPNPNSVLADLVGEGKKFRTVDDLAVGKKQSDDFIRKLETENAELRKTLEGVSLEATQSKAKLEVYEKVSSPGLHNKSEDNLSDNSNDNKPNNQKGLTHEDVLSLMELAETNKQVSANRQQVRDTLIKELGATADEYINSKAQEIGIARDELFELAGKSPTAFYNLVGISNVSNPKNSGLSTYVNGKNTTIQNSKQPTRNGAYYDKLRSEMGTVKFIMDKNLQIQLHKDMMALGDAW